MDVTTAQRLIASSRPQRGRLRVSTFVLLGISALIGALAADSELLGNGVIAWLLPQVLLLSLAAFLFFKARRQRAAALALEQGVEAVQLQQWEEAQTWLERVLSRPVRHPGVRAESLLGLAAVAEAGDDYQASQTIYESLLEENAGDPLQLHAARVALASAMLRTGQVTDAVSLIERLERAGLPDALRAQVELVALFRDVSLGQIESGIARAEERRSLFREYLSTRAGYGYALLAAAFDRARDTDAARRYWRDATLLVSPVQIVRRFGELSSLASRYEAVENPL